MANLMNFLQDNIRTNTTSDVYGALGIHVGTIDWEIVEPLHLKFKAKVKLLGKELNIGIEIIMGSEQANGNDCTYIRTDGGKPVRVDNVKYESSHELKFDTGDIVSPITYYKDSNNNKVTVLNGKFGIWYHFSALPENTTLSSDEMMEVEKGIAKNLEA